MKARRMEENNHDIEKQIQKHKQKLAEETKNYALQDYWTKEIENFEKQKEKLKKKL